MSRGASRHWVWRWAGLLAGLVIVAGGLQGAENIRSNEKPAQVRATYGRLPLSFEINQGQTDAEVTFLARGPGYTLFLTATEAVLVVRGSGGAGVVRAKLVGANARARVSGLEPLPGRSNYFIGSDPTKWRTDVPHYRKVRFAEVYRGLTWCITPQTRANWSTTSLSSRARTRSRFAWGTRGRSESS